MPRPVPHRAGVERVMGFCTDEQYEEFFHTVPEFEKMRVRPSMQLIKYWCHDCPTFG